MISTTKTKNHISHIHFMCSICYSDQFFARRTLLPQRSVSEPTIHHPSLVLGSHLGLKRFVDTLVQGLQHGRKSTRNNCHFYVFASPENLSRRLSNAHGMNPTRGELFGLRCTEDCVESTPLLPDINKKYSLRMLESFIIKAALC